MQIRTFCLTLAACLVSLAPAYGQAVSTKDLQGPAVSPDYKKSFSRQVGDDTNSTATATNGQTSEDTMSPLREMGSFPVRVHEGTANDDGSWPSEKALRNYEPTPVARTYRAGRCEFAIHTGDFTLRRYEHNTSGAGLEVAKDMLDKFTTLTDDDQKDGVLLSVTTELYVTMKPSMRKACKQLFAGRMVKFGAADLNKTSLSANSSAGASKEAEAAPVGGAHQTDIYLTWDGSHDALMLEDTAGLAPALESRVFQVAPKTAGDYYLAVTPDLEVTRAGHNR